MHRSRPGAGIGAHTESPVFRSPISLLRRIRRAAARRLGTGRAHAASVARARAIALQLQAQSDQQRAVGEGLPLSPRLCTTAQMRAAWFHRWCAAIGRPPALHRKLWEFAFIAQALDERGLLRSGVRGLGFGVGSEPLVALFASMGVEVVATDQPAAGTSAGAWRRSGQHSGGVEDLRYPSICDATSFDHLVGFRAVDMHDVPADLRNFDFVWSACALEHLGSLDAGVRFVERSIDCLKPGGVALHTTEFNLTSNSATVETPNLSIYRRRDIDALAERLRAAGHTVAEVDYTVGSEPVDHFVDLPPYGNEPHLRLQIGEYACTSIGLIVERGGIPRPPVG